MKVPSKATRDEWRQLAKETMMTSAGYLVLPGMICVDCRKRKSKTTLLEQFKYRRKKSSLRLARGSTIR